MKLTLKRDLPLLLAALLVIWGLWYAGHRCGHPVSGTGAGHH